MPLLLIFIGVPLIEIALFVQIGGLIGLWATLAIVLLTAFIGTWMLREQGLKEVSRLRASLRQMSDPTESLAHGAMILLAGALLLTPGFFTDTIGFLLLVPAIRRRVMAYVRSRVQVAEFRVGPDGGPGPGRADDVIEADYVEIKENPRGGTSGWTRH